MTGKKNQLIGIGSPVVDYLATVDDTYLTKISGDKGGMELVDSNTIERLIRELPISPQTVPGGSAGNTAFATARLGIKTTFLGKLGNDESGQFYKSEFEKMGGDSSRFKTGTLPNGRCLSLITPDSERTMRTDLGAALTLTPDEVTVSDFEECQHAHIEGYLLFNRDLMLKVLNCAKQAGCTISLDLASFEVVQSCKEILPRILEDFVDLVFANEEEALAFVNSNMSFDTIAKTFGNYCDVAVVKLGKEGSVIFDGTLNHIDSVKVEHPIDTTGAGDFWAAGFLTGWLQGKDIPTAGKYGSLLGAEVVKIVGTSISEETWSQLSGALDSPESVGQV